MLKSSGDQEVIYSLAFSITVRLLHYRSMYTSYCIHPHVKMIFIFCSYLIEVFPHIQYWTYTTRFLGGRDIPLRKNTGIPSTPYFFLQTNTADKYELTFSVCLSWNSHHRYHTPVEWDERNSCTQTVTGSMKISALVSRLQHFQLHMQLWNWAVQPLLNCHV